MQDINYTGKYLNESKYNIKIRTGEDILNATGDAICGELLVANGGDYPGLYIATKTNTNNVELYRISEITSDNKLLIKNNYSLSLDGVDDYATTATSVLNFYNTGGSISVWIKPSSVTAIQTNAFQNRSIISKGNVYLNLSINEAGYPTLHFYDGAIREVVATTQVSTSSWMHICATWSTTGSAIYVNGKSEATSSNTPANITSGQTGGNVFIGRTENVSPDYFGGLIDELAVFNTELSSSNVTSIYNKGIPDDISSFSPVNWWRMGDKDSGAGTTITDQGSGGNDATLTNGPTFSTDVVVPFTNTYSIALDGIDDYIDIGGSYDLGTFSVWFKPNSTLSSSVGPYMIAGFTGVGTYASSAGITVSGNITGTLTDEIITIYTGDWVYSFASSSAIISNTAWHHIAVRWTGSDYEIYLDGSQVKNTDGQAAGSLSKAKIAISNLSIGRRNNNDKFFPGLVDEVAIWSTPLSASDIISIYNNGIPDDLSSYSPVGWWRMGDNNSGSGTTVTDQGSGGNNGTLTNGPTFSTDIPSNT